ncbi:MAG: N4-gp56 family major capsid protein [Zoogloeaceae bacterium]|nr:N4-gp56 family major capsid protein [Zoogloeaceae bacterium]
MPQTVVGLNDSKAVKRYSAFLAVDTAKIGYWTKRFMGAGETASTPIQMLTNLESDAGEQITFDLSMQMKMQPIEGDDTLEGNEDDLKFYTDNVYIDQMRGGVNTGGKMSRKRTVHNLRQIARRRQSEWWARLFDELFFIYLSGPTAGATTGFQNPGFIFRNTYTGFANNSLQAPDSDHIMYGDGTSKATLSASGKMTRNLVERAAVKAATMGGGTEELPQLQPIMIDGEEHYVLVMHTYAAYDLRIESGDGGWLEIQKALFQGDGVRSNPIAKGGLGMLADVVLHKHKNVLRFTDYGSGSNVAAARNLFLGEQAGVCAFGSPGTGLRFDWHEETRDNGNQVVITSSSIFGIKKVRFNSKDYGCIAIDTAAADPG